MNAKVQNPCVQQALNRAGRQNNFDICALDLI
jgi:hypothetical protein